MPVMDFIELLLAANADGIRSQGTPSTRTLGTDTLAVIATT